MKNRTFMKEFIHWRLRFLLGSRLSWFKQSCESLEKEEGDDTSFVQMGLKPYTHQDAAAGNKDSVTWQKFKESCASLKNDDTGFIFVSRQAKPK